MRKAIAVSIVSCILATLLFGCSNKKIVIDTQALSNQIQKQVHFADKLSKADQKTVNELFEIESKLYVNYAVYISSGATAEEIAIFEATDTQSADLLYNAVQKRVETQKTAFENYMPNEIKKLQSPVIIKKDKYVIFCVCDNYSQAKEIISKGIS